MNPSTPTSPTSPENTLHRDERRAAAFQGLRQRAEQLLQAMDYSSMSKAQTDELATLYQDLMVFHIELDLQQDELFHSRERIEDLLKENFAAFELAPFFYWKVDQKGLVHHWNLLGAELFKTPRRNLAPGKVPLSLVLDAGAHLALNGFLRRTFNELGVSRMCAKDRERRPLHLFGRRLPDTTPPLALVAGVLLEETLPAAEENAQENVD